MRTEALRRVHSDPATTQFSPAMFAPKLPLPSELQHYRFYDPHTRPSIGDMSSVMLGVGVTAVRAARHTAQLYGVVRVLLAQLEREINTAASATMPPRLFSTRYWRHWFDRYGNVDFRRK